MEIIISIQAQKDIEHWIKTKNIKIQKRISDLKNAIIENPYQGIGNPEALKYEFTGKWSRRIDKVNRFIYAIENEQLIIYSLKGHYN